MTTRNFDALFEPKAIALVGASNQASSLGAVLAKNLMGGGFSGPIWLVNPHETEVGGARAYARIGDLPGTPDLAVIATPAATVPALVSELADRGARAAVIISAGLGKPPLRQALLAASRPKLLRIIGPNCLGFLSPARGVNASFAHLSPRAGGLALVSQSGAVTAAALDWAEGRGLGFSHVVTLGDMADVDFGDMLDWLARDPATSAIMLYVETITDARKFMSAGRIASRAKPVVVVKAGRGAAGARVAYSHTGALAGSDLVYDAALRRAGMLRVASLREMFDAVATLTSGVKVTGDRLAIVTNGGGAAVMAVDALEAQAGRLADLSPSTMAALNQALPPTWSHANPVDIIGDAPPARYAAAVKAVLADPGADALLVMACPTALTNLTAAAETVIDVSKGAGRPVLSCWMGDPAVRAARARFAGAHIPTFETPEEAIHAFTHLVERRRNHQLLDEVPATDPAGPDRQTVLRILTGARADNRVRLTEPEAKAVLSAYGVPVLESRVAASPAAAGALAKSWNGPFALKILSSDIAHKSDVGGVALDLPDANAVEAAARDMTARIRTQVPDARLEGFILQQMIHRPMARELIAGLSNDPTFGPVILFGQGGVEVEVTADRVMGLPPLNAPLARDMIGRTRVARRLEAWRDHPAADLDAVAGVLTAIAQLALDFPQIAELDINPLSADHTGSLALDARILLSDPARLAQPAIRPYPSELATKTRLPDGRTLTIRPITPRDAAGLQAMVARSDPLDIRLRFGASLRALPDEWAAHFAQIDYDREMALVGLLDGEIAGVARLAADPEGETAEFALMVRSDQHRRGLGARLMEALLEHAKDRGIRKVWGEVMVENHPMLGLARRLGFHTQQTPDPEMVRIEIEPSTLG